METFSTSKRQAHISYMCTLTIGSDGLPFSTEDMMDDATPTEEYVRRAKGSLRTLELELLASNHNAKFIGGTTVGTRLFLESMLEHPPCNEGKRYAACAIVACHRNGTKGIIAELHALAHDWLEFLLIPFAIASTRKTPTPSEDSASSEDDESGISDSTLENTPSDFLEQLKKRQGERCAVTDVHYDDGILTAGTHIIRNSLVNGMHRSLLTTWVILRHYAHLDRATLKNIENIINSPENGVLLDLSMCKLFNTFALYLDPKEHPNEYEVKWIREEFGRFNHRRQRTVKFTDVSGSGIPLPNRKFIQIHSSIAKVLHHSGAHMYFDKFIDRFDPAPSVMMGKFGNDDLDLRIFLTNLAEQNFC